MLLSPLTKQEAVWSSRIEGTQATLEEVLRYEVSKQSPQNKEADIQEIINYIEAMSYAVGQLEKRPINLNLIKNVHSILLDSVRGAFKGRGEYRRTQNWVGAPGASIDEATYVPPPPERLLEFLDNWEKYIHYAERDRLVQLAIVHAQFEVIHPFLDGNGRMGRILIPLFLYEKKLLNAPVFYISLYLEKHRDVYYEKLRQISQAQDWEGWIDFFLMAVIEQAKINTDKTQSILNLYEQMKEVFIKSIASKYAMQALDTIFTNPFCSTASFVQDSGIPKQTARRILNKLKENEVLVVAHPASGQQAEILAFPALIEIIN